MNARFGIGSYGHVVIPFDEGIGERRGFSALAVTVHDAVLPVADIERGILIDHGSGFDDLQPYRSARFHRYGDGRSKRQFHAAVIECESKLLVTGRAGVVSANFHPVPRKRHGFLFSVGVADLDVHVA